MGAEECNDKKKKKIEEKKGKGRLLPPDFIYRPDRGATEHHLSLRL
jgi:hypothetical protein